MTQTRPKSLFEVAERSSISWMNFTSAHPKAPVRLKGTVERVHEKDVYLAAGAEHLGRQFQRRIGLWAFFEDLKLDKPSFAYKSRAGRIFLLRDSPPAFKSRNLFVTPNVLVRG